MTGYCFLRIYLAVSLVVRVTSQCPFLWTQRYGSQSCYYFGTEILKTWSEARYHCMSMEGDLVRIDDTNEQTWLLTNLKRLDASLSGTQEWWTGLQRNEINENQWVWADNSIANDSFLRWGQGEPNNYLNNERCAEIWESTFNDKKCSMKLNYVCQRSKNIPIKCETQWEYHYGKCYRFFKSYVNKEQAEIECQRQEAEVLYVNDVDTGHTASVLAKVNKEDVWLAGQFSQRRNKWLNSNITSNTEVELLTFYWQNGEPTMYTDVESCIALNFSAPIAANWYTDNCTEPKSFACQKPAGICPPGYYRFGKRCYLFKSSRRNTWQNARKYCENIGSNLLEIDSVLEQNFIIKIIKQLRRRSLQQIWLGLVPWTPLDWKWISKSGYFSVTYNNINNGGTSSCVYLDSARSGYWFNDKPCNESLSFLCYQYNNMAEEERSIIPFTNRPQVSTTSVLTTTQPRKVRTIAPSVVKTLPKRKLPLVTTTKSSPSKVSSVSLTTTATPKPAWDSLCGPNWIRHHHSPFCYATIQQMLTWKESREMCKLIGGDLLSINSVEEQHFLAGKMQDDTKLWIGASSRGSDNGWQWSNGSPFAFLNFFYGQPDIRNGSDKCVAIHLKTSKWSDELCHERFGFFCKKRAFPELPDIPLTSPPFVTGDNVFGCPPGWIEYRLSCFLVVRNKTSWNEALTSCRKIGGDLASIKDEGEQAFVLSLLPKSHCYNLHHTDSQCDKWATLGECDINPVWMAVHCQKSCSACVQDCRDTYFEPDHCKVWQRLGECDKNPKWMLKNCALSCGVCDAAMFGGFWIGLNDRQRYMSFKWIDNSKVKFTTWANNEPNNFGQHGEDCVMMLLKDGKWNDFSCDEIMPGFVCKTQKQIVPKATVSPLSVGCVNDSIGYNSYCYSFNEDKLTWEDANSRCKLYSGNLATVNDRYVQAFVASHLIGKTGPYWIGLTQDYNSGVVEQWSNGQSVQFTYWSHTHTGNDDEDGYCVAMSTNHPIGLWETSNCTISRPFICEFPRIGFTTTSTTTTLPPSTAPITCESDWKESNGYCYKFFEQKRTWLAATSHCQQHGAELVSVHSIDEATFIADSVRSKAMYSPWIGLSDRNIEHGFTWSDGTAYDFTFWAPTEPNDGNIYADEDCACIRSYGNQWEDDNCFTLKSYICRAQKGTPIVPSENITIPDPVPCANDTEWLYLKVGREDMCYHILRHDWMNWYEARRRCWDKGATLVSITSRYVLEFIMSQVTQSETLSSMFWIGLNDLNQQGYAWSDRSVLTFLNWETYGRDINGIARCAVQISDSGRWRKMNCNSKLRAAVCQRKNDSSAAVVSHTPTQFNEGGCPSGYSASPDSSKCYRILDTPLMSNYEAKQKCSLAGQGSLASIQNSKENDFITSLARGKSASGLWIGLNVQQHFSSQMFSWDDNSEVTYSNWAAGEPSGNEFCVEVLLGEERVGKWNDVPCHRYRGAVCQAQKSEIFTIVTPDVDKCPRGYTLYSESCYKSTNTLLSRKEAAAICASDQASLVSINDPFEEAFVHVFMTDVDLPFWLGLQKKTTDFEWDDGWPYTYTNWNDSTPSLDQGNSCVIMEGRKWKTTSCVLTYPFLCEYRLTSPSTFAPGFCPEGLSSFQGFCYFVDLVKKKTWADANKTCINQNMDLASIHSEAELEHVLNIAKSFSRAPKLWIGLNKLPADDGYRWSDGTALSFRNWDYGEPSDIWSDYDYNGDPEECVEMYSSGKWNDVSCNDYENNYVCKMPEAVPRETTTFPISENDTTTSIAISRNNPSHLSQIKSNTNIASGNTMTAGEIMGILIGLVMAGVIVAAIVYVYLRSKPLSTFCPASEGFTNALYQKSADNVSISDDNKSISSQSRFVK